MLDGSPPPPCRLRLFIAGGTPRSNRAVRTVLRAIDAQPGGQCDLEVIDVYCNEARARAAGVVGVPALVRESPGPARRLVGELDAREVAALLRGPDISPPDSKASAHFDAPRGPKSPS